MPNVVPELRHFLAVIYTMLTFGSWVHVTTVGTYTFSLLYDTSGADSQRMPKRHQVAALRFSSSSWHGLLIEWLRG
jgi:hypothetical protein